MTRLFFYFITPISNIFNSSAAMFSYNVFLTEDQEELLADLLATYGSEIITTTNRVFAKLRAFSSNK